MNVIQGKYETIINYFEEMKPGEYFEFTFSYVSREERFRELDRFLWESKHLLRFRNEYSGDVIIDMTQWNNRNEYDYNEYFDAFMFFLKSRKATIIPAFIVNGKCSGVLFAQLGKFYEVHLIELGKGEVQLKDNHVKIGFKGRGEE